MKNKVLTLILVVLLTLSVSGCGEGNATGEKTNSVQTTGANKSSISYQTNSDGVICWQGLKTPDSDEEFYKGDNWTGVIAVARNVTVDEEDGFYIFGKTFNITSDNVDSYPDQTEYSLGFAFGFDSNRDELGGFTIEIEHNGIIKSDMHRQNLKENGNTIVLESVDLGESNGIHTLPITADLGEFKIVVKVPTATFKTNNLIDSNNEANFVGNLGVAQLQSPTFDRASENGLPGTAHADSDNPDATRYYTDLDFGETADVDVHKCLKINESGYLVLKRQESDDLSIYSLVTIYHSWLDFMYEPLKFVKGGNGTVYELYALSKGSYEYNHVSGWGSKSSPTDCSVSLYKTEDEALKNMG